MCNVAVIMGGLISLLMVYCMVGVISACIGFPLRFYGMQGLTWAEDFSDSYNIAFFGA
jgi:hypothetical protein